MKKEFNLLQSASGDHSPRDGLKMRTAYDSKGIKDGSTESVKIYLQAAQTVMDFYTTAIEASDANRNVEKLLSFIRTDTSLHPQLQARLQKRKTRF